MGQLAKVEALKLSIEPPSEIVEGDLIAVRFRTNKPAWLVVYYLEDGGPGMVIWPSPEEPEPQVTPAAPAVLPSVAELARGIKLQAQLRVPGKPQREALVAYAFAEKADFDRLKPAIGAQSDDGRKLEAQLKGSIEQLPLSRWTREMVYYVIEPEDGAGGGAPGPR
ncbi:MAG: hypothetical protein HY744_09960 [Deltaproteobacteria bacterium]|nr:hypothetical protein [Deltaproteobacteria bacterium]